METEGAGLAVWGEGPSFLMVVGLTSDSPWCLTLTRTRAPASLLGTV